MNTVDVVDYKDRTYRQEDGIPFYWLYELTGVLCEAMSAYIAFSAKMPGAVEPTGDQVQEVIHYLRYFFGASCWEHKDAGPRYDAKLSDIRARAAVAETLVDVDALITAGLGIGIDPL